ncbi:Periplasmic nitrate reductase protein NapE [Falsiruegeria litorea R37]|uniref:Periplasmic nitrate reductase protein NapE n=1 Tax=Falsiruegeria litorea R37 TaxID=1200284 RepID=A0A1Y5SM08_9RHOB|nr:periplasmic nitrate reductase, NapE protein [Falsiruegeria litorea]SLN43286.1 Periplasmic nitrate reductase protein NapE [Falsiruegeria litorea R37]
MSDTPDFHEDPAQPTKSSERTAFLILAVVLAPALSVAIVGGWGFFVWILQMFYGPPTG